MTPGDQSPVGSVPAASQLPPFTAREPPASLRNLAAAPAGPEDMEEDLTATPDLGDGFKAGPSTAPAAARVAAGTADQVMTAAEEPPPAAAAAGAGGIDDLFGDDFGSGGGGGDYYGGGSFPSSEEGTEGRADTAAGTGGGGTQSGRRTRSTETVGTGGPAEVAGSAGAAVGGEEERVQSPTAGVKAGGRKRGRMGGMTTTGELLGGPVRVCPYDVRFRTYCQGISTRAKRLVSGLLDLL